MCSVVPVVTSSDVFEWNKSKCHPALPGASVPEKAGTHAEPLYSGKWIVVQGNLANLASITPIGEGAPLAFDVFGTRRLRQEEPTILLIQRDHTTRTTRHGATTTARIAAASRACVWMTHRARF